MQRKSQGGLNFVSPSGSRVHSELRVKTQAARAPNEYIYQNEHS